MSGFPSGFWKSPSISEVAGGGPAHFILSWSHNGTLSNDWMGITSVTAGARVLAYKCQLIGIGFACTKDNANTDLEIYKNGQAGGDLEYTWEIRSSRYDSIQLDTPIEFDPGDYIFLYGSDAGSNDPTDTHVDMVFEALLDD